MRNKIWSHLLVLTIILSLLANVDLHVAKAVTTGDSVVTDEDISLLQSLITEGEQVVSGDGKDSVSFSWVMNVMKFNEKYPESFVYDDIRSECNSAKNYSSVNTFNTAAKITGYLCILKDELMEDELPDVDLLINKGEDIVSKNSTDISTYSWVINVLKVNERYPESFVYDDIKSECKSAKNYSSVNTFNTAAKITGYLCNLEDELADAESISIGFLISEGEKIISANLSDSNSYYWVVNVSRINEKYSNSSVYEDIKSECKSAQSYSSVNTFNTAAKIVAYLGILREENTYIYKLEKIIIVSPPNKISYKEGEKFDQTGMAVNAVYVIYYLDGTEEIEIKENVAFIVETNTELQVTDTNCIISFTDCGIKKTAMQNITVCADSIDENSDPSHTEDDVGDNNVNGENTANNVPNDNKDIVDNNDNTKEDNITNSTQSDIESDVSTDTTSKTSIKNIRVSGFKLKKGKKKITVIYKKIGNYKYEIQISSSKSMKKSMLVKTIKDNYTFKNLKKKHNYFVRVRAYQKSGRKIIYGKWSMLKKVKTK